MKPRKGPWMVTRSGHRFYPLDPRPCDVCLEDIGAALGKICRFGGHAQRFYSVAEHSMRVAELLPPKLAMLGLLHDAAEAYVGDMIQPLKKGMPAFKEIERGVQNAVWMAFNMWRPTPVEMAAVRIADLRMLVTERRDLLTSACGEWGKEVEAAMVAPTGIGLGLAPEDATLRFIGAVYGGTAAARKRDESFGIPTAESQAKWLVRGGRGRG